MNEGNKIKEVTHRVYSLDKEHHRHCSYRIAISVDNRIFEIPPESPEVPAVTEWKQEVFLKCRRDFAGPNGFWPSALHRCDWCVFTPRCEKKRKGLSGSKYFDCFSMDSAAAFFKSPTVEKLAFLMRGRGWFDPPLFTDGRDEGMKTGDTVVYFKNKELVRRIYWNEEQGIAGLERGGKKHERN